MKYVLLSVAAILFVGPQDGGDEPENDKIEPRLQTSLDQRGSASAIILGSDQLLEMPDGFAKFKKKNERKKRLALRKDVVSRLKKIAAGQQKKILKAIGDPEDAVSLWLVNAIAVTLSPEDAVKLSRMKEVKYIYPGPRVRKGGSAGVVSQVLTDVKRGPFTTEGRKIAWNLKEIGAVKTWSEHGVHGKGVTVAMLDTGVNYLHEDLTNNIWRNAGEIPNNGKDDDKNGYVDDYYGFNFGTGKCEVIARGRRQHGTMTSGIVAGDGTGGTLTGVAPRAKLMCLVGWDAVSATQAHQYAIENGADVINMSFSMPNLGNLRGYWRLMSEQAVCAGLIPVSGAGNFQQSQRVPVQQRIPEGIPCVISAGGLTQEMEVPRFCSLGPVEWSKVKFYEDHPMPEGLIKPDVCGFPGPDYPILASANKGYIDPNRRTQGNSFSAPHISGVIALMLSAYPDLTAWKVKEILEATARDLDAPGKDNNTGAGLADAFKAVGEAKKLGTKYP